MNAFFNKLFIIDFAILIAAIATVLVAIAAFRVLHLLVTLLFPAIVFKLNTQNKDCRLVEAAVQYINSYRSTSRENLPTLEWEGCKLVSNGFLCAIMLPHIDFKDRAKRILICTRYCKYALLIPILDAVRLSVILAVTLVYLLQLFNRTILNSDGKVMSYHKTIQEVADGIRIDSNKYKESIQNDLKELIAI